jgi:hypothetical protein
MSNRDNKNKSKGQSPVSLREMGTVPLILVCFLLHTANAAFLDLGWNAKTVALGGASAALHADPSAANYNPAGVFGIRRTKASFMYALPYAGLDMLAGGDSTSLGINRGSVFYPGLRFGTLGLSMNIFSVEGIYSENSYILHYSISGEKIKGFFKSFSDKDSMGGFSFRQSRAGSPLNIKTFWGMNMKLLNHSYTPDIYTAGDPVFASASSKSAISMDLGMLMLINSSFRAGLSLNDLNSPDTGIYNEDKVPMAFRIGAGYEYNRLSLLADFSSRSGISNIHLGLQYALEPMYLRAGFNLDELSGGFGLHLSSFLLDYSLAWPLAVSGSFGSHRLELGIYFGQEIKEEKKERAKKRKKKFSRVRKRKTEKRDKVRPSPEIKTPELSLPLPELPEDDVPDKELSLPPPPEDKKEEAEIEEKAPEEKKEPEKKPAKKAQKRRKKRIYR